MAKVVKCPHTIEGKVMTPYLPRYHLQWNEAFVLPFWGTSEGKVLSCCLPFSNLPVPTISPLFHLPQNLKLVGFLGEVMLWLFVGVRWSGVGSDWGGIISCHGGKLLHVDKTALEGRCPCWVTWRVTSAPDLALLFVKTWLGEMPTEHHERWEGRFLLRGKPCQQQQSQRKGQGARERPASPRRKIVCGWGYVTRAGFSSQEQQRLGFLRWQCLISVRGPKERMTQGGGKGTGLVMWPWTVTSFAYFSICTSRGLD